MSIEDDALLVLSTRVNEGFADDIPRVLAYPSGWSLTDPFRYTDRLVSEQCRQEFQATSQQRLAASPALLGLRIHSADFRSVLFPVRFVTITRVQSPRGLHMIRFRLGDFVRHPDGADLQARAFVLPTASDELVFLLDREAAAFQPITEEDELQVWCDWVDALAGSKEVHPDLRSAVFIRVNPVVDATAEAAPIGVVETSTTKGNLYGPVLNPGTSYEFSFYHRVPELIRDGHDRQRFSRDLVYTSRTEGLSLDRSSVTLQAHYQQYLLNVTPTRQRRYLELSIVPGGNAWDSRLVVELTCPLRSAWSWRFFIRSRALSWLLVFLAFFISTEIGTTSSVLIGDRGELRFETWFHLATEPRMLVVALAAAVAATLLFLSRAARGSEW
jgi:hypothetical protein